MGAAEVFIVEQRAGAQAVVRVQRDHGNLRPDHGKERDELRRLAGKADLKGMGRDLVALRRGRRGRKRR